MSTRIDADLAGSLAAAPIAAAPGATDDLTAASVALRALAAADGGEVLAGQLSRLVAVIANEAVRTRRFRTDLLAALVPAPEGEAAGGTGSRPDLERMTKAQLQKLIDSNGMDPRQVIKTRTTKGEMVDLIVAFQQAAGRESTGPADTPGAAPDEAAETVTKSAASPAIDQPPANPQKRRRQPSLIDPYEVAARDGLDGLRAELQRLDVEQLKDVIAEYGMNYDGRAMGWKDHHRFVERVLEKTGFGTTQGDAFRSAR
ncbi:hypothetical protein GA0111570_103288 [Raineyella antarctica]|uniref:Uncharacterized protein n=1 Tax=Raineyella antarctica TaxID=1577474 RepID=A0A1G6GHL0_9ACTN|nr:hypothetical protein [Raineyella antarctica]SDB81477.1 hypothetical protein GA0111570_103288 [Raineyella antarctica]